MTAALEVIGVSAQIQQRQTLGATDLQVEAGESLAVVGRSGAGKSTLADIVLGLRMPTSGTVRVSGTEWVSPRIRPSRQVRRLVQGVPQDPGASFVPRWTIRRAVTEAIHRLVEAADPGVLIDRAADLAHFDRALLDRHPTELSGGQAQRAAIMRALAVQPTVLVADEPTSALDPATARSVTTALLSSAAESGAALLLVTHDPDVAARCHRSLTISAPDPENHAS